ncbi:MAG: hypothetical protein K8I82_12240 [Anaerolineae bacterium]|nr:hypothetical protein [Anaerolineae bacterium]
MTDFNFIPEGNDEDIQPTKPMQPVPRHLYREQKPETLRQREPIQAILEQARKLAEEQEIRPEHIEPRTGRREVDPLFAYLLVISLAIGLSPITPAIRYVFLWALMGILGLMGYLLGTIKNPRETHIVDLAWGLAFGFLSSAPFLIAFGASLDTVSVRMFDVENTPKVIMDTWVLMAVVFAIPACESLFFRGTLQEVRSFGFTVGLSTLWSAVLFFPHMELGGREVIGLILLIVFGLLNFMYSYVRVRNGLAAAWICQAVSYGLLWFLPRLL